MPQTNTQSAQATEPTRPSYGSADSQGLHGRGISASDLVASLKGSPKPPTPAQPVPRSSSTGHQDQLLKLLNQNSSGPDVSRPPKSYRESTPARDTPSPSRYSPGVRVFGSKEATPTQFKPEPLSATSAPGKAGPVFTYTNPFEQLSASSPLRSLSRNQEHVNENEGKNVVPSETAATSSANKLTTSGSEILQSIETPVTAPSKDERSQADALDGIGAPTKNSETVAEALNEVGDKVHKQMEAALAEAESKESEPQQSAEPEKDQASSLLKAPDESVAGEDASTSFTNISDDHKIITYQLPMRPFVSLEIKKTDPSISIREDTITHIARFKKDFDQLDRTLTAASRDFIVYGMPRNGGIRLIQQENGASSLLFPHSKDRIFNVAISTNPSDASFQRVIATGLSGAVYWTTISDSEGEPLERQEDNEVTFPPVLVGSDSSIGQLKTRAKKSSRHPNLFGIGRGKSIHIVFPLHARTSTFLNADDVLDTEKYFADRSLKVSTGKAGKDFAFSEDDTVIATIDKAGKLRLWDIRDLIAEDNGVASKLAPIEVKTPTLSFTTGSSSDKLWPTSVLFVDKVRAYAKGVAQRYIIVGMKQNHVLQLWDLCLGKAVQELCFPHENENDPICSIAFHPETSIITVGHPTRNSLYFVQLSVPKYSISAMSQAKLAEFLAAKELPSHKTEATAIMSTIREVSLGSIGQLRSVEITPAVQENSRAVESSVKSPLFDLYVMHSKGVTCLGLKKEDMGWSSEGKPLHRLNAEKECYVNVKDLLGTPASSVHDPTSVNGDAPSAGLKSPSKILTKDTGVDKSKATPKASSKAEKKKLKSALSGETLSAAAGISGPSTPREASPVWSSKEKTDHLASEQAEPVKKSEDVDRVARDVRPLSNGEPISLGISSDLLDKEVKKIEKTVSTEFNKSLSHELETLHQRLDRDKQVQNAAAGANQEAILRLVSQQLGDNVEKALSSIVLESIRESVTPSVANIVSNVLEKNLAHVLGQQLEHILPVHLKSALPSTIGRVMQQREISHPIAEQVAISVKSHIEKEVIDALKRDIIPVFQNVALSTFHQVNQESEKGLRAHFQQAEAQRREDASKIDQLATSVRILSDTMQHMAEAQANFQAEILNLQQKSANASQAVVRHGSPTPSESASLRVSPEQQEIDAASALMQQGKSEDATIMVRMFEMSIVGLILTFNSGSNRATNSRFLTTSSCAAIQAFFFSYQQSFRSPSVPRSRYLSSQIFSNVWSGRNFC